MPILQEFLHFTKKQRNALFVLLFLVIGLQVFLYFDDLFYPVQKFSPKEQEAFNAWVTQDSIARFEAALLPEAFLFNPNEANDSVLAALGLKTSLRRKVINYRNKGGAFKSKRDLQRIYGMDSAWFEHVEPFIQLPDKPAYANKFEKSDRFKKSPLKPFDPNTILVKEAEEKGLDAWRVKRMITYREKVSPFKTKNTLYKVYGFDSTFVEEILPFVKIDTSHLKLPEKETKPLEIIDLALADSATLTKVRGIGGFSAKRIVEYREKLGGFISKNQLLEVYGIKLERYTQFEKQLSLSTIKVKKLNVNTATFKELLEHPYMEYEMVKALLYFRENSRLYKNVDELVNLEGFTPEKMKKLKPYLEV